MPNTPLPNSLCVLGLGLIGGSLLRAAAPQLPAFGWSPSEATRAAAAKDADEFGFEVADNIAAALQRAVKEDALVVLAAPVTAFTQLLRSVAEHAPTVRLTDVGGVKAPVAEQVAQLAPRTRYIGSHPMTGTEHSGWEAGTATLFESRSWVTTLSVDSDLTCWSEVAGLAVKIGSRVVPCEASAHDGAVARISHLPHLVAAALAEVGRAGGPLALSLAAGSFADGTRVAATRPELVRAMCESNAGPLIDAMDEMLAQLGVARGSLGSSGSLAKLATTGYEARAALRERHRGLEPVTLRGDEMIEQLLSVGAAGGYVTAVASDSAGLRVEAMFPMED